MKARLLNTSRLSFPLASAIAAMLAMPATHAAILYYDGGTVDILTDGNAAASATSGNWNTGLLNWDTGPSAHVAWNNANNDTAFINAGTAFAAPTPGTVTLTAPITVGGLIFNTSGYTITGNTLTLGGTNNTVALNNLVTAATISSAIGTSAANMTFTAQNPLVASTVTFGGAGGWTGTTTVNAGVVLQLNNASTALLNTSGIILNGGTITQNYNAVVDRISTGDITSYGGTLNTFNGNVAVNFTETVGAVTLASGMTTFLHSAAPASLITQTLILTSLNRTGATNTSTVNFAGSGGMALSSKNRITVTGATQTTAGQIIGPWATAGNTAGAFDYAIYGTGGSVLDAAATLVAGGEGSWTATTDAYNNNVVTQTLGATRTLTALRNTATSATLTLASGFNLETYGVLNGAATTFTVAPGTGGALTTPTGGGYLYLNAGTGAAGGTMTVSAPVTDNGGTVSVVKSGLGTLNLTGTNTFKGGILVNSGSVVVTPGSANSFATGAAGADIINGGNLTYSSANAWGGTGRNTTFNGTGTLTSSVAYTGGTLTVNSGANAVLANTGNLAYVTTTGSGAIIHTPGNASSLLNLGNASGFTGNLQNRGTASGGTATGIQFSSLGDGGALQFAGGNGDGNQAATFTYNGTSALTFGTRQIQILQHVTGNNDFRDNILANNSADAAHTWTIGTDLLATGGRAGSFNATGTAFLILSGTNTGNNAFNGVISNGQYGSVVADGAIGVTKSGTGANSKWILGGNNTYSGATAVSVGILNIQHANALGSTASGTTVANAASLQIQGGITTAAEALTLTPGTGGSAMLLNVSGTNTWSGSVTSNTATSSQVSRIQSDLDKLTLAGAVNLTGSAHQLVLQGNGDLEISGQVTGVGRITGSATGTGVRTLSNDTNIYTGSTSANGGTIAFKSIENVGATSSSLGAPILADATINVGGNAVAGALRYVGTVGGGHTSDRVIRLNGDTGGATIEANGSGALVLTGGVTGAGGGAKTLTLRGTNTLNNSIAAIGQNSVPNQVSVTKENGGTWVLTGSNTYTGATAINAGTLVITGATQATNAITFGGGVLGLNIASPVTAANATVNFTGQLVLVGGSPTLASYTLLTTTSPITGTPTLASPISGYTLQVFTNELRLVSTGGGTPYDTWAGDKGLTGANNAKTDDPENDGRNNLGEFAFNGDPLSGSDNGKVFVLTEDSDFDGDALKELILTVAVRTGTPTFSGSPSPSAIQAADGITYIIEGSLDLAGFPTTVNVVPTPVTTGLPAAGTGYEYRSFSLDGSNGLTGKGFLRAKVTSP
jgi:fibronectin-binding autotransporter adhesin